MKHSPANSKTTHFGFETVPWNKKANKVKQVFHSVAGRYDLMNDVMSLGLHRIWKRFTLDHAGVCPGQAVLDLAGGTGDFTKAFSKRVGQQGSVVLADINNSMLQAGRDRLINLGLLDNITYIQANAETLPFPENHFDCITIAFGLRNVTDKDAALKSMYRVLKPGGRLLILEFSSIKEGCFKKIYDTYSFKLIPSFGQWITGDKDSYQYLVESIRMHPDQETLKNMMLNAGFNQAEYKNLSQGAVALHIGLKT